MLGFGLEYKVSGTRVLPSENGVCKSKPEASASFFDLRQAVEWMASEFGPDLRWRSRGCYAKPGLVVYVQVYGMASVSEWYAGHKAFADAYRLGSA